MFGRGEMVENRELVTGQDWPAYRVAKMSLGVVRDLRIADHLLLGAGDELIWDGGIHPATAENVTCSI